MKKIFRMANAELNKIFMRPSMFVLTGILILTLVFSFFLFSPSSSATKYTNNYVNTTTIHNEFVAKTEEFDQIVIFAKEEIDDYLKEENDVYDTFKENFHSLRVYFDGDFSTRLRSIIEADSNPALSNSSRSELKSAFSILRTKTDGLIEYMRSFKNYKINFFITQNFYNTVFNSLKNFYGNLPSDKDLDGFNASMVIERHNFLKSNYNFNELDIKIQNLEKINIDSDNLSNLLTKYFYSNFNEQSLGSVKTYVKNDSGKLQELANKIDNYYFDGHVNSTNTDEVDTLNNYVAQYYDYVNICKTLISNNFELLRIGNKTDSQIATYVSFGDNSIYNIKSDITKSQYFFDNNTFGYEYLSAFNFNVNSGTETNAYDFAFYAMQIISVFITIFVIFFATSTLSGEQTSGTLKMTATRPYTRNKIFSGKLLACFNVALILISVSLVASLAVGFAFYGFSMQNVLIVINAKTTVIVNPIVLLLVYLASMLIDIIFYIIFAVLVSMLIKQPTVTTGISCGVYVVSLILQGVVTSGWIRFVPSLNLGLYKFFTTSSTGILSFSVVPNMTLVFSTIYVLAFAFIINLFARLLFKNRSLDK